MFDYDIQKKIYERFYREQCVFISPTWTCQAPATALIMKTLILLLLLLLLLL